MRYEQTGMSFQPRVNEPKHLAFTVHDDAATFAREGFDAPSYPAWGFDLLLEGRGTLEFRRWDARGFSIPLLLGADGVSRYFRAVANIDGPSPEELADQLVSSFVEFSPEKPPQHVSDAACARIALWFSTLRRDVVRRRTPVGRLPYSLFVLNLLPVGEGSETAAPLSLASRDVDCILAVELAGRVSLPPEGDWAPRVVNRDGESPQALAAAMLTPLFEAQEIEPAELFEEVVAEVGRWLEYNRWGLLPPISEDDAATADC